MSDETAIIICVATLICGVIVIIAGIKLKVFKA